MEALRHVRGSPCPLLDAPRTALLDPVSRSPWLLRLRCDWAVLIAAATTYFLDNAYGRVLSIPRSSEGRPAACLPWRLSTCHVINHTEWQQKRLARLDSVSAEGARPMQFQLDS